MHEEKYLEWRDNWKNKVEYKQQKSILHILWSGGYSIFILSFIWKYS